jgi:hypothetical protein
VRRAAALFFVVLLGVLPLDRASGVATAVVEDRAQVAGIYEVVLTWSASAPDVDRDGDADLMIVPHSAGPARLYRNQGGRFTRMDGGVFAKKDRHDCQWADVDRDGRVDAYCTIGAHKGTGTKSNELWLQRTAGHFTQSAAEWGVADRWGRGRNVAFIDVNHDPYPDLYVGNDFPRQDGIPSPNRLFINTGGTRFRSASEYGLDHELGAFSVQAVDYDNDGWEDLLVAGKTQVRLYRNQSGQSFADVSRSVGINHGGLSARLVDVDGDGPLDFVLIKPDKLLVKYGGPTGALTARTTSVPLTHGARVATGDVNADGYTDLYIVQSGSSPDRLLLGPSLVDLPIPQATSGGGQAVTAFDHDGNGRTDFVVLNGGAGPGPVQLLASYPA